MGDFSPRPLTLTTFVLWTAATALGAVWAHRRNEGRRFH